MRVRNPLLLLLVTLALALGLAVPAAAAPDAPAPSGPTEAVAYQIGVSHDGFSGDTTVVPPLAQRWSRDLGGSVSYPLIAGGRVFVTAAVTASGFSGTTLFALDQATGAALWSVELLHSTRWSNAAYDAGRVFVVDFDGLMQAFDAATGTRLWSTDLPGQYAFSSPPTAQGGIVYTGGAGTGGTVYAVSQSDGAVLWTQPVSNGDNSSPALSPTSAFVSYSCGLVYAFDRATGDRRWLSNGPCSGGGGKTPVYHDGRVYARDFFGNKVLDADTGALLGSFQAGPAPAFAGRTGLFLNGAGAPCRR
jgi:outer membrane protein assembly factor BamB